jgi:hypothetical protein
MAALVTLMLHLLIAVPVLLHPFESQRPRPSAESPLVFAGSLAPEKRVRGPQSSPRWVTAVEPSAAIIDGLTPPPHVEIPDDVSPPAGPVPDFIRCIGIITGRIQGAWLLPSVPRSHDFHCRVRLHEDAAGIVSEVELWECDDDPQLRESLLKAIRASAPWPVLQVDSQPEHVLTLDFAAYASLAAGRRSSVEPSASLP